MKHTIQNLTIAIIIPIIMFTVALWSVQHVDMPKPFAGKFAGDSISVGQGVFEANASLTPYLKFDSIKNVCDSATTAYFTKQGRVYHVKLGQLFPNAELKGLEAFTTFTNILCCCDFYCDGGPLVSDFFIVKKRGEYMLFNREVGKILLGYPSFDLRDDLWHNLGSYGTLTNATIILLVSLSIIFISFLLYHPKSNLNWVGWTTIILLGAVWLYGYNGNLGQDKFYEYPNIILLYMVLCWLCSTIALFAPLEEKRELFEKEKKEEVEKEKRTRNGVDTQYLYKHRWIEVGKNNCSLTFNMDGTAFYTNESNIEIFKYSVNTDWSIILKNREKKYFVRHWYRNEINSSWLIFKGKSFTKDGRSIEEMLAEYEEKRELARQEEEKFSMIDSILGRQSKHSGGNIVVSIIIMLVGFCLLAFGINKLIHSQSGQWMMDNLFSCDVGYFIGLVIGFILSLIGTGLYLGLFLLIWGSIRIYHNYLFSKRKKLIAICNEAYGKLGDDEIVDYLHYCMKHGAISIEEYSNQNGKNKTLN